MALAWLAAYPVVFVITLHRAGKVLGLTLWDFGGAMLWPVVASALMAVAVTMARGVVPDEAAPGVALLILVPIGAATYVAALFTLHRSSFRETLALVSR